MSDPGRRLALVTGGSRGIGRAICLELARGGADVAFTYFRNEAAAAETTAAIEALGRRAVTFRGRVDTADRCLEVVERAAGALGGLDVLVSNAASGVARPAMDVTEHHWDWTVNTNARALLFLTQAAVPHLEARRGGSVVGLSSLGAGRVLKDYTLVGISKAALEAAIRYLAVELAPRGVRVNGVSGAVVDTGALQHFPDGEGMLAAGRARTPAGRLVEAEDIARVVAFLVSDAAAMIVGQTIIVDGGYSLPI
jgi:enoyl-[acyl-carrier protein] reductase III